MKSFVSSAVVGLVLYGVQNAIIEQKLKGYPAMSLLMGFYLTMLPLGFVFLMYQKYTGQTIVVPEKSAMLVICVVAAMFFIGDYFFVGAYSFKDADATTICILGALVPVVAALTKFVWVRKLPTMYHFGGFVLALAAVALIAYGNIKTPLGEIP